MQRRSYLHFCWLAKSALPRVKHLFEIRGIRYKWYSEFSHHHFMWECQHFVISGNTLCLGGCGSSHDIRSPIHLHLAEETNVLAWWPHLNDYLQRPHFVYDIILYRKALLLQYDNMCLKASSVRLFGAIAELIFLKKHWPVENSNTAIKWVSGDDKVFSTWYVSKILWTYLHRIKIASKRRSLTSAQIKESCTSVFGFKHII